MASILVAKFDQNPDIKRALICTHPYELIEGNWWGDVYWGVCKGKGKNKLGKLLMNLRQQYVLEDPKMVKLVGKSS